MGTSVGTSKEEILTYVYFGRTPSVRVDLMPTNQDDGNQVPE